MSRAPLLGQVAFSVPVHQPEPKPALSMRVMEGDDPHEVRLRSLLFVTFPAENCTTLENSSNLLRR